ncbi:hypothetical protein CLTEP_27620 [Clostridium tepidiprofundi DSM 19306]|uniref:Uncharacterized protein n=1 Tax=Clostridium tepidiprofundi DSM 19306 TaxID=1121338 RepID=A0A151AKU6_9CLOT|nr:transposase [Clostridium tepidiprofundi]KYH28264.1 hypothetical protein CLTEP_27620 [Clostridium tepidiprofundi DSM 19306]
MLKNWRSHTEYQNFLISNLTDLYKSIPEKINKIESIISKLYCLNLDVLYEKLKSRYSNTGRPALYQPEIFRSFCLMLFKKETSLTNWVKELRSNELLATCIGCTKDKTPSLGAHYDFISRLWLSDLNSDRLKLKKTYSYKKKPSKTKAPGKNNKLPNKKPGVVKRIADFFYSGRSFSQRFEKLLQEIFTLVAVEPSFNLGLIQKDNLTLAGDGTCVHCKSSYYGSKVCDCRENGIFNCKCPRKLSDTDATWGWDSDENRWFYGYTLYALSTYNKQYKIDLPVYLRFVEARRHDSVTGIVALAEFRELLPQSHISNYVLDSANDNYPTYELCSKWNINPFIDLNSKNKGNSKYPSSLTITEKGVPICIGGHKMVYDGYEKARSRHKWRCPLVLKKVDSCNCTEQCSPSPYGRVIHTKPSWDIRLFTPIPRGSKQWKKIYKTRTSSERINNRILNDYKIHSLRVRGKKRYSFFTMISGINIHLDARIKVFGFSILNLL